MLECELGRRIELKNLRLVERALGEGPPRAEELGAAKTGVLTASFLAIAIAVTFDLLLYLAQRRLTPWQRMRPA